MQDPDSAAWIVVRLQALAGPTCKREMARQLVDLVTRVERVERERCLALAKAMEAQLLAQATNPATLTKRVEYPLALGACAYKFHELREQILERKIPPED